MAGEPLVIEAVRIAGFEKANPARRQFGRLEFRGGLILTSKDERFGGLSDLVIGQDGRQFTAISDGGTWIAGEIMYEGAAPAGVAKARIGPLAAINGRALEKKRDHDAEAMALVDGSLARGTLYIAFERNHRIGKFRVRGGAILPPTGYITLPPEARRMKPNQGFEAVTVLQGGRFDGSLLAIAERFVDADDNHTGWLWVNDTARRVSIRNLQSFDVTSAAALRSGAVIILERYFRWTEGVKMRLRHLEAGAFELSAPISGDVLLEADMGYEIDNMEGVAVHTGAQQETVLTLISDNNFNNFLQRTLLLQFTLRANNR